MPVGYQITQNKVTGFNKEKMTMSTDLLTEKWAPVLNHEDMPAIQDKTRASVLAQVLENTEKALSEEAAQTGLQEASLSGDQGFSYNLGATSGRAGYDPILISLVRRSMPQLMAFDLCGVQPMNAPTGLIFALKSVYENGNEQLAQTSNEAFYNEARINYSGTPFNADDPDTHRPGESDESDVSVVGQSSNPFESIGNVERDPTETQPVHGDYDFGPAQDGLKFSRGGGVADEANSGTLETGMTTRQGEGDNFREMSFSIERTAVVAKTRALKSEYTMELVQDLKAVHGLDAEAELANILSTEIMAEINAEVLHVINSQAVRGANGLTTPGVFDLIADGQGRWSVERQKGLMLQIEKECNQIAFDTRRGKGNFVLVSANVASALTMAGLLDYSSALKDNLTVDVTAGTYAGVLNNRTKVYVDPYATADYITVGYKGTNSMDAGVSTAHMYLYKWFVLLLKRHSNQNWFQNPLWYGF